MARNWILAAAAVGLVTLGLVYVPPLRVSVFVPALMLLPGYLVTVAILRERRDIAEQVTFSLLFSVVLTILVGLGLGAIAIPLQALVWWVLLGVIGVIALAMLLVRRSHLSEPLQLRLPQGRELVMIACAILLVALAIELSSAGARDARTAGDESVPVLWLLPQATSERNLTVGVANIGSSAGLFRVSVIVDGSPFRTYLVDLDGRADWSAPMRLARSAERIDVVLYAADAVEPVRHVWRAVAAHRTS